MSVEDTSSVPMDGVMLRPGPAHDKHVSFFAAFLSRRCFLRAAAVAAPPRSSVFSPP